MPLHGALQDVGLPALLRLLLESACSGRLALRQGDLEGSLLLKGGRLVGAAYGPWQGLNAVDALVLDFPSAPDARFAFEEAPRPVPGSLDLPLDLSPQALLARVEAVAARREEVAPLVAARWAPSLAPLAPAPDASDIDSGTETLHLDGADLSALLALSAGARTLDEIAPGRDLLETAGALARLRDWGLARILEPPAPPAPPAPEPAPPVPPAPTPRPPGPPPKSRERRGPRRSRASLGPPTRSSERSERPGKGCRTASDFGRGAASDRLGKGWEWRPRAQLALPLVAGLCVAAAGTAAGFALAGPGPRPARPAPPALLVAPPAPIPTVAPPPFPRLPTALAPAPTTIPTLAPPTPAMPDPAGAALATILAAENTLRRGSIRAVATYSGDAEAIADLRFDLGETPAVATAQAIESPRLRLLTTYRGSAESRTFERVVVGGRAWDRAGTEPWRAGPAGDGVRAQVEALLPGASRAARPTLGQDGEGPYLQWQDVSDGASVTLRLDPTGGPPRVMRRVLPSDGAVLSVTYADWNAPVTIVPPA